MLVALAAIGLAIVTSLIVIVDNYMQRKRMTNQTRSNLHNTFRRKNVWELTQLDCDLGCAWPHTSGPARTLRLGSTEKQDQTS